MLENTPRIACIQLAATLALACPALDVLAQQQGQRPSEAAMQALGLAKYYYKQGGFVEAAKLFHRAFAIDPRPEFLYNAARAEQRAAMLDEALAHYRELLEMKAVPEHVIERARLAVKEIVAVKALLAKARTAGREAATEALRRRPQPGASPDELQGVGGVKARGPGAKRSETVGTGAAVTPVTAVAGTVAPVSPSSPGRGGWRRRIAWPALGAGAAVAGIGGWLLVSYLDGQADLDVLTGRRVPGGGIVGVDAQTYRSEQRRLNTDATVATALLITGAAVAGAGAWALWTTPDTRVGFAPVGRSLAFHVAF